MLEEGKFAVVRPYAVIYAVKLTFEDTEIRIISVVVLDSLFIERNELG